MVSELMLAIVLGGFGVRIKAKTLQGKIFKGFVVSYKISGYKILYVPKC